MGKIKEKTKNQGVWIQNRLDKFERLNVDELKLLINGTVKGIAPVQVTEKRGKCFLTVQLENQMTLAEYLRESVDTDTLITVIAATLKIALECEGRGLCLESLCWDEDHIFFDLNDGQLTMLYWPVIRLDRADTEILYFYRNFSDYMIRDAIDPAVMNGYLAYFYQRDSINLSSFWTMFRKLRMDWEKRRKAETMEIRQELRAASYAYGTNKIQNQGDAWLENDRSRKKIWLSQKQLVFGRAKDGCDVIINDDISVSRRHARIRFYGGCYYLEDLKSKNGTYLEGRRLESQVPAKLTDGAQIRFGDSCFVFRLRSGGDTVPIFYTRGGNP